MNTFKRWRKTREGEQNPLTRRKLTVVHVTFHYGTCAPSLMGELCCVSSTTRVLCWVCSEQPIYHPTAASSQDNAMVG